MNAQTLPKVLVIPTAVAVLILGVLLYRWSSEINASTSARLADGLRLSMSNWHQNLYRDLADVASALRVDGENSGNLELLAQRFRDWRATAPHREAAAGFFVFRDVDTDSPRALRSHPETDGFTPIAWPASLQLLREALRQAPAAARTVSPTAFPRGLAGWSFEPSTPALVRPIESLAGGWLVVELDREVIRSRMLPDLARRYFAGVEGLDYQVAVVSGPAPREVIYASEPGFGEQEVSDADGRMDVFGRITARRYGSPLHVFHSSTHHAMAGAAPASETPGTSWFPLLDGTGDESGWQLIVRLRRDGALGALVAEMHRRDLALSFGVLLLLVVNVAMLIATSLRAHRLAQMQMDFVTAVSHELRSPLTVIGSAAENITHGVVEGREQIEQYGRVIERQTRQLARLVEEVLLFAATREKRRPPAADRLAVDDIVQAALAGAADLIATAEFRIERDIPSGLPPVRGDLAALSQCLQNLITNALKYGGDARWIGLRAGVEENGPAGGREVYIRVSDRGPGIEPRDLPHIFEPFHRGAAAKEAQIRGAGLGLALARSIAEAMHGRLTVASEPGQGAAFTLHLPAAEAPARVSTPAPS